MESSHVKKAAASLFAIVVFAVLLNGTLKAPTPVTEEPISEPTQAPRNLEPVTDAPTTESASPQADIAATPLSVDLPADIPTSEGVVSSSEYEFMIPADVTPSHEENWVFGLSPSSGLMAYGDQKERLYEQRKRLYHGLVRAGLEDIGLCSAGDTCPAAVRFRSSSWAESWEPIPESTFGQKRQVAKGLTLVQATFTTGSTWNEIVYTKFELEERGWRKTSEGWQSVGVLSHVWQPRSEGFPQDEMPPISEKAYDVFRRLLACTYNDEDFCGR